MQNAEKVLRRTQSPVADVRFGFTKMCSEIPGKLVEDPDFRCRCLGNTRVIDGRHYVEVQLAYGKLDVLDNFVYLGDYTCPGGGCELATIKWCLSAWESLENS